MDRVGINLLTAEINQAQAFHRSENTSSLPNRQPKRRSLVYRRVRLLDASPSTEDSNHNSNTNPQLLTLPLLTYTTSSWVRNTSFIDYLASVACKIGPSSVQSSSEIGGPPLATSTPNPYMYAMISPPLVAAIFTSKQVCSSAQVMGGR